MLDRTRGLSRALCKQERTCLTHDMTYEYVCILQLSTAFELVGSRSQTESETHSNNAVVLSEMFSHKIVALERYKRCPPGDGSQNLRPGCHDTAGTKNTCCDFIRPRRTESSRSPLPAVDRSGRSTTSLRKMDTALRPLGTRSRNLYFEMVFRMQILRK